MSVYSAEKSDPSAQLPEADDAGRQPRVLIVDDSKLQRKILSSTVKRWGFDVVEAETANAALAIVEEFRPDIILSDWMMPGMNGLEFCDAYRKLSGDRYGYFILLTSKSDKNEVAAGLDAGADDFLTKPVNAHELRARVRAGERILNMQRELSRNNKIITETLEELQRLYDSLDDDLIEAKKLQQSLIPERSRTFDTGELNLLLRQSGHVGGDLVGFFPAGEDALGLFSIDVSGHGISSALMTARLAGYLSATAPEHNIALEPDATNGHRARPPKDVIEELNALVLNEMDTEHYFTLIIAILDLNTGHMTLAQAGHPHPVVQRANGQVLIDGPGGFPVGLVPGAMFSQFELKLEPGDRFMMFSDGVSECPDPEGNLLEDEGLASILADLRDVKGHALFEALMWKLNDYADGENFPDDISGVLFEFAGPAKK